jgi:hypothetical protein
MELTFMKNKILLVCLVLWTCMVSGQAGNWFVNVFGGNSQRNCQEQTYSYAYHMGSNYNNSKGLQPVYPARSIVYTPWVKHYGPVPEYVHRNPKAIVKDYGSYYLICYANYIY